MPFFFNTNKTIKSYQVGCRLNFNVEESIYNKYQKPITTIVICLNLCAFTVFIKNRTSTIIKRYLGCFRSLFRQVYKIALPGWASTNVLIENKIVTGIKFWGHWPSMHFLTSLRICSLHLTWAIWLIERFSIFKNYSSKAKWIFYNYSPIFTKCRHLVNI